MINTAVWYLMKLPKQPSKQPLSILDQLNIDRVNAQQARRFLIVWWALWYHHYFGQRLPEVCQRAECKSVATRLVVEREREIRAFVPVEYWKIHTNNTAAGETLNLEAVKKKW